jgi:hypothetical protein
VAIGAVSGTDRYHPYPFNIQTSKIRGADSMQACSLIEFVRHRRHFAVETEPVTGLQFMDIEAVIQ